VPGGTQLNAPNYVTSDQMWALGAAVQRGEVAREELERAQSVACPTCGACQFMGSASTGQVLAEALGLALPGSALIPTPLSKHLRYARMAGKQVLRLIDQDITPRRILTRAAFENAIMLHAAVGGSTNALLHLPVIAREVGVDLSIDDFDRIHRRVPVLANAKTTGRYPVEYLWYAGGVPAVMLALRDLLNLDCLTVTGRTLGENLEDIAASGFFAETRGYLNNLAVDINDILRPRSEPFGPEGGIAVLRGNLAPRGAVVKYFSVPDEMHVHVGPARVFDREDDATHALLERQVRPGDVVIIRYEGPRANGMPEMYFATTLIAADATLTTTTAVVTDGRYSGAAKGPAVGHVTPEAIDGGPIALVEDGDLIEIHVPQRRLAIVGAGGRQLTDEQVQAVLAERRARWVPPPPRHHQGILDLFARVARGSDEGASIT
jgi:dihydroxy-acid dehydratase